MSQVAKKVLTELLEEVEDVSSTVKAWAQAKLDKLNFEDGSPSPYTPPADEAPAAPAQPPVDNDHVAKGATPFSDETAAANKDEAKEEVAA